MTTGIQCVNVRSKADRKRLVDRVERIRRKEQRVMRSRIANVFNLQRSMIETLEGDITLQDVQDVLARTYVPMEKVFEDTYLRIADAVYPMTVKTMDRSWHPYTAVRDYDTELDYQAAVREWIRKNCGEKIVEIDQTTLNQVKILFAKARNQAEFREMMSQLFDNSITPFRSNAIARTETASATNRCSLETMRSTGFEGEKKWMATLDMSTRDTHIAIDGLTVGMDERFKWTNIKGESIVMDCPADSTYGAPAHEVINCRCNVIFEF